MKKTSILVIALLVSTLAGVQAQDANAGVTTAAEQTALPAPTPYSIVERGANNRAWERTTYERAPDGTIVPKKHQYTELAAGLHYLSNGQWVESKEQIDILPQGGAAATQGQHKVYFPGDIYQGVIEIVTPDGKHLKSRPMGISYDDGNNTVLIAQLKESAGVLVSPNRIVYPDAFTGCKADLVCTYRKGKFECDLVFREQPPLPEAYGLSSQTSRLQLLTEFFNTPDPVQKSTAVRPQNGPHDATLQFGSMIMGHGKAFVAGAAHPDLASETQVFKSWLHLGGRTFLLEEVPVQKMAAGLQSLPVSVGTVAVSANSVLNKVSATRLLVPSRLVRDDSTHVMQLAKADLNQKRGVVLDYVLVDADRGDFTFQADTTYYISNGIDFGGNLTFEGGTVIKYGTDPDNPNLMECWGGMVCDTSPYRPAIFTSVNDDTVGEPISDPNMPLMYYWTAICGDSSSAVVWHDVCIRYARVGFEGYALRLHDCQFVDCLYPIVSWQGTFSATNVLIVNADSAFSGVDFDGVAYNVTVDGCTNLTLDWWENTDDTLALTNCLLVNVQPGGAAATITTNHTAWVTDSGGQVFQVTGAGSCYLPTNSPYHNAGTTNIDPAVLADIATKTTYPPIVYSNRTITVSSVFSPQAQRDTNAAPDLGYHYAPLDYVFGGVEAQSNLTFTAGTAVGWFDAWSENSYGIILDEGATAAFNGTATSPCWLARYDMVQEAGNGNWTDRGWLSPITCYNPNDLNTPDAPKLVMNFTKFSSRNCNDQIRDYSGNFVVRANDCEFYGAIGGYNIQLNFTNCLFYRYATAITCSTGGSPSLSMQNCTTIGGGYDAFTIQHWGGCNWPVSIRDCIFDGTTIRADTNGMTCDYNAFLTNANLTPVLGGHEVTNLISYNWQSSWLGDYYLPIGSPLTDADSTTADQVGLYHFTTQTNQVPETNSYVDIGYHYVATDTNGIPLDSNGDGIPDYLEDANGNGVVDNGETNWALAILAQPANVVTYTGTSPAFGVTARGVAPIQYQWYSNTTAVASATNAALTFNDVQTNAAGSYCVVVANNFGSITSAVATLVVIASPPIIIGEPANQTVVVGSSASFSTTATGSLPLSYQWYFNRTNALAGSSNGLLTLNNVQLTNGGSYYVVVTNNYGSVTSVVATLAVFTNTVTFDFTSNIFSFNYQGSDGTLAYQYAPGTNYYNNGSLHPLTCVVNGTNTFLPSYFGGLSLIATNGVGTNIMEIRPWDTNVTFTLVSTQAIGNTLQMTWQMGWQTNGANNYLTYSYTFQMTGRRLAIQVTNTDGISGGIDLDRCENATNSVIVCVPYLTLMNVLYTGGTNGAFCSMYFDWEHTAASTIIPRYSLYNVQTNVVSTTSVYYAQIAGYLPRTDSTRGNVSETIYLTVSPSLTDVLPNVLNPQSPYKTNVANYLVFDNFQQTNAYFASVNAAVQTLATNGVSNLWVIVHDWQNQFYDNGYPDVLPANTNLGGSNLLLQVSQTASSNGYLFALHENYMDFYTNAASSVTPTNYWWNTNNCALDTNGFPKWSSSNPDFTNTAYEMKPSFATNCAAYFAPLIHNDYGTSAGFLDRHSSVNPSQAVDYDPTAPGAGTFLGTLSQYRALCELLRTNHNGPVSGEGYNHMLYLGYIDDVEAEIDSGGLTYTTNVTGQWLPLLVDFDLLKLHGKTVVHGVGYYERFYADQNNTAQYLTYSNAAVLEYMATELAYGHGGFFPAPDRLYDYVATAKLEQRHVLPVQRLYANATPVSILYHDPNDSNGNNVISASDYIRRYPTTYANNSFTNSSYMSQVRVTYNNGVVVCVNRHPLATWSVQLGQAGGWFDLNAVKGFGTFQWTGYTNVTSYTLPATNGWVVYVPKPLLTPP